MANYSPITVARFWSKVDVGHRHACWNWKAATDPYGYGVMCLSEHGMQRAHRLSCMLVNGPAPDDANFALHQCDNRLCCNPAHLRWGNGFDNMREMVDRGRMGVKRMTPEVHSRILGMRTGGATYKEISTETGYCGTHIAKLCRKEGLGGRAH